MASTPDLNYDKEASGQSSFRNQFPSDHLLTSQYASRTREKYSTTSGSREGGSEEPKKGRSCMPTDRKRRRWLFIGVPVALVIIAAIIVGVLIGIDQNNKPKSGSGSSAGSGGGTTGDGNGTPTDTGTTGLDDTSSNPYLTAGTGKSGSTVTTDLGVQFDYVNNFGGEWAQNPENPYSVSTFFKSCLEP
jgi:hypothetical protein